jgi:hypothetical protein
MRYVARHISQQSGRYRCIGILTTLVAGILFSAAVTAAVPLRPADIPDPQFNEPRHIVRLYLLAVDRGELHVFTHRISKAMISPTRVEYIYKLDDPVPTIRVFSELTEPLLVLHCDECRVRGVSAVLTPDGRLTNIEAHISTN